MGNCWAKFYNNPKKELQPPNNGVWIPLENVSSPVVVVMNPPGVPGPTLAPADCRHDASRQSSHIEPTNALPEPVPAALVKGHEEQFKIDKIEPSLAPPEPLKTAFDAGDFKATLMPSTRFNFVDAYINITPKLPENLKHKIVAVQVKANGDDEWLTVPHEESVPKFGLVTVELESMTQYEIQCIVCIGGHSEVTSNVVRITTKHFDIEPGVRVQELDCFFPDTDKRDAAVMLMRPNISNGVFFLRPSGKGLEDNCFALSVRAGVKDGCPSLKKYQVFNLTDGYGCFISPNNTFEDVNALIDFYRKNDITKGLRLTEPFVPFDSNEKEVTLDEIKLSKSALVPGENLGGGKFGIVFKARLGIHDVAVKELKIPETKSDEAVEFDPNTLLDEALTMSKFFNANVVKLIAVCADEPPYWLISEFMNGGSLKSYFKKPNVPESMNYDNVILILRQVASGMAYLEEQGFIHRDLRTDNVLVHVEEGQSLLVKIADFGLSRLVPEDIYQSNNSVCPIRWTAPEALQKGLFTSKSDVWSFGILAFEIFTLGKSLPYPMARDNYTARQAIISGEIMTLQQFQAVKESLCPEKLYNKLKDCWQMEKEDRPDFAAFKSDFDDFDVTVEQNYDKRPQTICAD